MPEFTLKQLIAQIEALGFMVGRQSNGHFKVKRNGHMVAGFAEKHGSRTKRGMVKPFYYNDVIKRCKAFLDDE